MPNALVSSGNSCRIFMVSACALMGLTALPAAGEIVYFDVNPDLTLNVGDTANFGDINVVTETYTLGSTSGNFFGLNLTSNEFRHAIFDGTANGTIQWAFEGEGAAPKLPLNTEISGASPWSWSTGSVVGLAVDNLNNWGSGGTGYAALQIVPGAGNYNYGWAEISYTPNGSSTTATVTGFAFQGDANTAILVGATVPEPSTYAMALAGLACGGYSFFRRRKRRRWGSVS